MPISSHGPWCLQPPNKRNVFFFLVHAAISLFPVSINTKRNKYRFFTNSRKEDRDHHHGPIQAQQEETAPAAPQKLRCHFSTSYDTVRRWEGRRSGNPTPPNSSKGITRAFGSAPPGNNNNTNTPHNNNTHNHHSSRTWFGVPAATWYDDEDHD